MILPDFKAFPKQGRIIGIDWGARRVGVAVSDETRQMVFTRPVIAGNDAVQEIVKMVSDEKISGIVLGLPLRTDGSESDTTKSVRGFANDLSSIVNVPICFIDETLSSISAQETMGRLRQSDIKQNLDSESARLILENAISIINRIK